MIQTRAAFIAMLVVAAALISCAGSAVDLGEDYGSLADSPDGIRLVEEEHPDGWRRAECSMCHNLDNIHLDDSALHDYALQNGEAVCSDCHGENGVE